MSDPEADVRSYYEEEARLRLRKPRDGPRVEFRSRFIALLKQEGNRSVVDYGSGPGLDGQAFTDAGLRYVGLDIAGGNAGLAAENGLTVIQGSVSAPPFRDQAFEAGWSMSTLMHLPEEQMVQALSGICRTLSAGAPLFIGLWGGESVDVIDEEDLEGQRRLFSLRPLERNQELISAFANVERTTIWELGPETWHYQTFELRVS